MFWHSLIIFKYNIFFNCFKLFYKHILYLVLSRWLLTFLLFLFRLVNWSCFKIKFSFIFWRRFRILTLIKPLLFAFLLKFKHIFLTLKFTLNFLLSIRSYNEYIIYLFFKNFILFHTLPIIDIHRVHLLKCFCAFIRITFLQLICF